MADPNPCSYFCMVLLGRLNLPHTLEMLLLRVSILASAGELELQFFRKEWILAFAFLVGRGRWLHGGFEQAGAKRKVSGMCKGKNLWD